MINCIKSVNTKDYPHSIVLAGETPITGYVDELATICENLSNFFEETNGRKIRLDEWQTILYTALRRKDL
jgi:hypothetical protein